MLQQLYPVGSTSKIFSVRQKYLPTNLLKESLPPITSHQNKQPTGLFKNVCSYIEKIFICFMQKHKFISRKKNTKTMYN